MDVELRPLESSDWDAVAAIYRNGIGAGLASFETEVRRGRSGTRLTSTGHGSPP